MVRRASTKVLSLDSSTLTVDLWFLFLFSLSVRERNAQYAISETYVERCTPRYGKPAIKVWPMFELDSIDEGRKNQLQVVSPALSL